jgi:GGDEF domain-containing protein
MTSKKIKVFIFSMVTILIIAGIYFLAGIITNSQKGKIEAQNSFLKITSEITDYANEYGLLTENFLLKTNQCLEKEKYLNAITIQKNSVVFFAYPLTSNLLKADDNKNAFISTSSPLVKIITKSSYLNNGDALNFSVAYNTILPEEIFRIGKIALIIIFSCTLLTIIVISYMSFFGKKNQKFVPSKESKNKENSFYQENNESLSSNYAINNEVENHEMEIIQKTTSTESIIENQEEYAKKEIKTKNEIAKNKLDNKTDPLGLFSNITGFGWENYLEERLDAELIRASSSEQDVSLFMIGLPDLDKNSNAAQNIYQVILDFFKYRDLIFEYKDDSIVGIFINMDLPNAMKYAEQLFINLYDIFEEFNLHSKIAVGISTRSMRLITGNRLITEAQNACEKALEEEKMPIVAFKVNHEKYTEYNGEEE